MSKEWAAGIRLAMREEGPFWNAYFAQEGTMKGAVLLGSIRVSLAEREPIRIAFLELMKDAMKQVIEETTRARVEKWGEAEPAAEHERSGHG